MPVIRHVRITPREAEQLREIRVNMQMPGIAGGYLDELRALLLRLEQDALGVKPWPFTGCAGPLTDCDMEDASGVTPDRANPSPATER